MSTQAELELVLPNKKGRYQHAYGDRFMTLSHKGGRTHIIAHESPLNRKKVSNSGAMAAEAWRNSGSGLTFKEYLSKGNPTKGHHTGSRPFDINHYYDMNVNRHPRIMQDSHNPAIIAMTPQSMPKHKKTYYGHPEPTSTEVTNYLKMHGVPKEGERKGKNGNVYKTWSSAQRTLAKKHILAQHHNM